MRILIVDDEPAILRTLTGFLRLHGFDCHTAGDGEAALRWLEEETAHLVMTDLVMPGVDGMELIRRMRSQGCMAEVIVMTAYSTLDRAVEAYQLGAGEYLLKPFESLQAVLEVVHQAQARFERWRAALASTLEETGTP